MRQQQQQQQRSRSRGRGRKSTNPMSRNYESNGPEVKVRGNASHVADKYNNLARDALTSGDTVMAENYYQHAEHYNRIVAAAQAAMPAPPPPRETDHNHQPRNNGRGPQPNVENAASQPADNSANNNAPETVNSSENSEAVTDENKVESQERAPRRANTRNARPRSNGRRPAKEADAASEPDVKNVIDEKPAPKSPAVAAENSDNVSDDAASLPSSLTGMQGDEEPVVVADKEPAG